MIKKYPYHKPQTNSWHREEVQHNHHEIPGSQTKQRQTAKKVSIFNQRITAKRHAHLQTLTKIPAKFHNGGNLKKFAQNICTYSARMK